MSITLYDNEAYAVEVDAKKFADGVVREMVDVWFHDLPIRATSIRRPHDVSDKDLEVIGRTIGDSLKDAYNSGVRVGTDKVQRKIKGSLGL